MFSACFILLLSQTRFHLEAERFSLNNWCNLQLMFLTPISALAQSSLSPLWFLLPSDPSFPAGSR